MKKMDEPYKPLGRGQRLQSVINMLQKQQEKRPETIQEQLFKITGYDCSNEAAEKFCDEFASNRAESYRTSMNSKRMNYQSPSIVESEGEGMWDYWKDFPSLDSQDPVELAKTGNTTRESDVTVGCSGDYHTNFSPWNAVFNEDVAASTSQSSQQPDTITKGVEKGEGLTMEAESIAPSRAAFQSDIQKPDTIAKGVGKGKGRKKVAEFIAISRAAYESNIQTPDTITKGVEKGEGLTMEAESIAPSRAAFQSDIQKYSAIAKGIGRGERLRMVIASLSPPKPTFESYIQRALGTDCTNESIERFVKELAEKNERSGDSKK